MPPVAPSSFRSRPFALLAGALTLSALAGCLESSATSPATDSGASKDGGGATRGPDATTAGDSGSRQDGKTVSFDAPTSTGDAGALPDGAVSIPSCLSPTAAETACAACDEKSCASTVAAAVSTCASFYTCYEKCSCSDATCIGACESAAASDSTCVSAAEALQSCQKASCATACATPDAGSASGGDAATFTGDAGVVIPSCKNPTTTDTACASCVEHDCTSAAKTAVTACSAFYTCFAGCDCSGTSCIGNCESAAASNSACVTAAEALQSCQTSKCTSSCTAKDGGAAAKDGGGAATIPNCTGGASTEVTTYKACLACDQASCGSQVTAAVAACTAYYACWGTTSCATAATACAADTTTACTTAVTSLTTCQNASCWIQCSGL